MKTVIGSNINANGMFISIILLVVLLGMSCSDQVDCCTIIDTDVSIRYLSLYGENLLETHPDHHPESIKIYYKQTDGSYKRAVNFLLE